MEKQLSAAQRRASRRRLQGKATGAFDFNYATNVESLDEYYDVSSSYQEIEAALDEYRHLNSAAYIEFKRQTQLSNSDIGFLFLATALQVARQYLLTNFKKRPNDQEAAEKTKGKKKETSNRKHRYYNPSLEEIISSPVPFDAITGSNGVLKGGGKLGHRVTTLGHDPILGLVFGTANIATSTLTDFRFNSYHIETRILKNGVRRDAFKNRAKTHKVFEYTANKLLREGFDGKKKLASSLCKEVVHLHSDVHSKNSLPIPFVSAYDPKLASELAKYNIDMDNVITVGKQASYAMLINWIISALHQLLYDPIKHSDKKIYEVRTRKIILYSNTIASSSNLICTLCSNEWDKFDLGGLMVTLYRIAKDEKFIRDVMHEYVDNRVSKVYAERFEQINREYTLLCSGLGYNENLEM